MKFASKIALQKNQTSFQENFTAYQQLEKDFNTLVAKISLGGEGRAKHEKKGKLFVRDRLKYLLDPGSAFLELSLFAGYECYEMWTPSAGIVTGIGCIEGRLVMVIANDATVKGGAYFPLTVKKHLRAQQIAAENHLPCVTLVDSAGAFLPYQSEVYPDRNHFGRIFYHQAQMSAKGIPQLSVILGSCTAGGAYIPALSDETIMLKKNASIFLAGPPLVQAATGESVSEEELGGATVHSQYSGLVDYVAQDELHALYLARQSIRQWQHIPVLEAHKKKFEEPCYPLEEIMGFISSDLKRAFDVREVIARIVDASWFHEFKASYGNTLVCAFAKIWGYPVGILANNGVLYSQSALKGAHFIELCSQRNIPLVFLQNTTGFIVGKQAEMSGIAKDGAKLVMAVSNAAVPKLTIIIGGSFGAGNYAMCGRAFDPRFLWMWPNAKISVMGKQQAAFVLTNIKRQQGSSVPEEKLKQIEHSILEEYEIHSNAYYSSARLWDDGIILPSQTRNILGQSLSIVSQQKVTQTQWGIFRM